MTSSFKWRWIIGAALLVVGVSFAFAQAPSPAGQGAPMYDLKTETTIK